jgi:hypothetical protein
MAKTASQVVRDSEQRRGVQSTSFKFSPDEIALLDELAEREGGRKAAVIAGLHALRRRNEPTPEEALRVLERAIRGKQ